MKRIIALLSALALTLALCACGGKNGAPAESPAPTAPAAPAADTQVYDDSLIEEIISAEGGLTIEGWTYDYAYHVPKLKGDTPTLRDINRVLDEIVGGRARSQLEDMEQGLYLYSRIGWESHWQDGLLSLVISEENIDGWKDYMVIHYNFAGDERLDNSQLLQRWGVSEEDFLRAARRAVAQEFDKAYAGDTHNEYSIDDYYIIGGSGEGMGGQTEESALLRRANAVAGVSLDTAELYQEGGAYKYLASLPVDGEWYFEPLTLDFTESGVSKTVKDRFVTATLENDRVFLTFDDTEEAAYYLLGYSEDGFDYQEGGRGFDLPGDALPLGAGHRYEVQGLFSRYKDLFLGDLGYQEYLPYLFLVTEDDALEMVYLPGCFQFGVFCAMPIPGTFDAASARAVENEYGSTVIVRDHLGTECDLERWAYRARQAYPLYSWSGVLEEIQAAGGSYARVGNLDFFFSEDFLDIHVTELDVETSASGAHLRVLGMNEDGVVCAYTCEPWENDVPCAGAFAYTTRLEWTENRLYNALWIKMISGVSPYGCEGETISFYRRDQGDESGWSASVAAAPFAGVWQDEVSGRCEMVISWIEKAALYEIMAFWGDSASDTYVWSMTAEPDETGTLYYSDCTCRIVEYGEYGAETEKSVEYTDGSGSIVMSGPGVLRWQDGNFERSGTCRFTQVNVEGY